MLTLSTRLLNALTLATKLQYVNVTKYVNIGDDIT